MPKQGTQPDHKQEYGHCTPKDRLLSKTVTIGTPGTYFSNRVNRGEDQPKNGSQQSCDQ